jgi:hypothetical protein
MIQELFVQYLHLTLPDHENQPPNTPKSPTPSAALSVLDLDHSFRQYLA